MPKLSGECTITEGLKFATELVPLDTLVEVVGGSNTATTSYHGPDPANVVKGTVVAEFRFVPYSDMPCQSMLLVASVKPFPACHCADPKFAQDFATATVKEPSPAVIDVVDGVLLFPVSLETVAEIVLDKPLTS